jgi:hypothetical protein
VIAGLITMVLAVTVGAAVIGHSVGALPAAPPGHPASGTAVAPPDRQPSSASPGRKAHSRTSPGNTGTLQMDASDHRSVTAPQKGREKTQRHLQHKDASHGQGHGTGQGNGSGNGTGQWNGNGEGTGQWNGNGDGTGQGNGNGHGQGNGKGNAPVRSVLSQLPAEVLARRL